MRTTMIGMAFCGEKPVHYYLLTQTMEDETELYGVRVCFGEEEAVLPAVTSSRREVQELLERLVRGAVTPVTLRDVVEDWLLE